MSAFVRGPRLLTGACALLILRGIVAPGTLVAQEEDRTLALVHKLLMDRQAVVERGEAGISQASLGERLRSGNLVATSPNTRAAIRFTDDGSLVRLNPNSRLQVTSEGDPGRLAKTLQLEFGELWARVSEQEEGTFQVETPSGVAAVVGTDLVVRVDQDGTTTVLTLEGAVRFFNDAGEVEIPEGQQAVAASDQAAAEVGEIPEGELEALGGLVGDDEGEGSVRIEIPVQNDQGVVRTVILQVPRAEAASFVDVGGN